MQKHCFAEKTFAMNRPFAVICIVLGILSMTFGIWSILPLPSYAIPTSLMDSAFFVPTLAATFGIVGGMGLIFAGAVILRTLTSLRKRPI